MECRAKPCPPVKRTHVFVGSPLKEGRSKQGRKDQGQGIITDDGKDSSLLHKQL